ncbi:hypothetical protein RJ639_044985 [Escallonia herrerae]|uniref:Uncharacterized protein n=1 Tax=Escallonia herrerae TaxID=1293975 RepID=A0AA88W8H2_9ASTE|nr:hypothetical protein RJ639_044985 [Escallonia herrerae]
MTNQRSTGGNTPLAQKKVLRRAKLGALLQSDPNILTNQEDFTFSHPKSPASLPISSRLYNSSPDESPSPYFMSPYTKSPWVKTSSVSPFDGDNNCPGHGLIGSLVREEGHVYSLAASGDFLYTGSDSKNVRVWKNLQEFSGFKSNSGLVKAIVVSGGKIFTGHQDGKIRVWKLPASTRKVYKRIGNLPTTKDYLKSSINPKSYVEVRRKRNVPWIKHFDAVSAMSLDEDQGLLYSGSWDKTLKVWRLSDSKCLESVKAHDDAVNSVVAGSDGLVFTGSADGTVKVWRRDMVGNGTTHVLVQTLLKQENAVTALAASAKSGVVYGGTSDGLVNFWEREKHSLSHGGVLRGHKLAVLCLAAAGNLVMSGSADKSICVWRREQGADHVCVSVLTGHTGPVKCLAVDQDRDGDGNESDERWTVYSGSLDKSVMVWRVSEHAPDLRQLQGTNE